MSVIVKESANADRCNFAFRYFSISLIFLISMVNINKFRSYRYQLDSFFT